MTYIGIRGHRGSGKSSVAWLLSNVLDIICHGNKNIIHTESFNNMYKSWCDKIMEDQNIVNDVSFDYVYLESFSDSIKVFIQLLLGCPVDYMYNDKYKDDIIINLRDFSWKLSSDIKNLDSITLVKADELYDMIDKVADPQPIMKNIYITLREFIMYFGLEVMQRFFGRNVWVKSLRATSADYEAFYTAGINVECYKVYMDMKTPAEVTYIKQHNGFVIDVVRPGHKKGKSGLERLGKDDRIDYTIEVNGDLLSIKDDIVRIALDITSQHDNYLEYNEPMDNDIL